MASFPAPLRISLPPLTKGVLVLLTLLTLVDTAIRYTTYLHTTGREHNLELIYVPYITLIPSVSIIFPWTFLTATYVEEGIFAFAISFATLMYGSRYCERVWGWSELAKFLAIVGGFSNLAVFIALYAHVIITGSVQYEFRTINGTVALQAGFLVALKQLVPEHAVVLFRGLLKVRVKSLPALFLLLNTIIGLFEAEVNLILTWAGFFTAWIYLRFFRISTLSGVLPSPVTSENPDVNMPTTTRGDASDTFALAGFFPDSFAPLVDSIATYIFGFLVKIHVCTPFSEEDIDAANQRNNQIRQRFVAPLPGSVRAEAERRRALALKALDQRLSQNKKETTGIAGAGSSLGETNFVPDKNQS
ncbi:eukaryotic integral membrane protein-domain-containing protein [Lipomyces oligophaga]|uniref:eukaryotic integral membrane protein-domain-containing protein n=1 Tax=Lipomyces oligophaga TaxID=45792 RepID=UPI0034CF69B1